MRRSHNSLEEQERNNAPLVEIFGGLFALLLVLFLLMNLLSQLASEEIVEAERMEAALDEELYRVGWGTYGSGYIVITFPQELRIVQTGQSIPRGRICAPGSPYRDYARQIYSSGARQQIIFALLEGSVATMAEARSCLIKLMPSRLLTVGWIIADNELLKSVSLDDIPPHIKKGIR